MSPDNLRGKQPDSSSQPKPVIPEAVWDITPLSIFEQLYLKNKFQDDPEGLARTLKLCCVKSLIPQLPAEEQQGVRDFLAEEKK